MSRLLNLLYTNVNSVLCGISLEKFRRNIFAYARAQVNVLMRQSTQYPMGGTCMRGAMLALLLKATVLGNASASPKGYSPAA